MTSVYRSRARLEIVSIASKMLAGDIPLVEGARALCELRHRIGASESELFSPIVGFDSETDDYPVGIHRQRYSQKTLSELDQEMADYLAVAKPEVLRACREIVAALQGSNSELK